MTELGERLTAATGAPRAEGAVEIAVKPGARGTALDHLRHSGSLRSVFPHRLGPSLQAVLVNTAGGVTGGDAFSVSARAAAGTALTLSTQAAERAYRAMPGPSGRIRNRLFVAPGARLHWLPQETILFEGSSLDRRLVADVPEGATLLLAEALVFGRAAMGERLNAIHLRDRIELRRDGRPLFLDAIGLSGDAEAHLDRPWVAGGARAMATVVLAAPGAAARLDEVRAALPKTGGASLHTEGVLVARLLAPDGFTLRQSLVPLLTRLAGEDLPRAWMT